MLVLDSPESVDLTLITHFLNHHAVMPKFMTYTTYIIVIFYSTPGTPGTPTMY